MKPKVRTLTAFLITCLVFTGISLSAEEKTKEYKESWPANSVQTLEINNRFGEVRVADKGGSDVTIDVVVTVEASSERKAQELLDLIDVSINKTGIRLQLKLISAKDSAATNNSPLITM